MEINRGRNQFKSVQQSSESRQQVLISYCPNVYTVELGRLGRGETKSRATIQNVSCARRFDQQAIINMNPYQ